MPELIRLYIRSTIIGFAVAAAMVAMLLWLNVANLGYLVTHSDGGILAVFLLWVFNGIVFAGVQFGIAIMGMAEDDDDDTPGGGLRDGHVPDLLPVPVRSTDRRR